MESIGQNVRAKIEGDKLTIEVDLAQEGRPSKTGKTTVVGTTGGFVRLNGIMVGLNVCRK